MHIHALDFNKKYRLFNFDWRFFKGDCDGAEQHNYDDSSWRLLDLPHDWSIEGPFDKRWASGAGYLPAGIGWYRKSFRLSDSTIGKKLTIRFDGIYKNAEVWVNGEYLGKRPYGYSSFHYDLTPYVKFNGLSNSIAVKVSHPDFADSRWYPGSGIYRNVFLGLSDRAYLVPYGIYVTTLDISESKAQIRIEATLANDLATPAQVQFVHIIRDAHRRIVAIQEQDAILPSSGQQVIGADMWIEHPRLWSVAEPNLYSVETSVIMNGHQTDVDETVFGIRTICFDTDNGFFLNGTSIKMKGVCLHHDAGALGAAVPGKVWERRLRLLKEAGVNAIRMSHNPPDPILLDLCDTMGFLVIDEAFDEWELPKNKWVEGHNQGTPSLDGYAEHFAEWAEIDLRDMVLRDRNHPSIILWSIGNEIDFPNDPYSHPVLGDHFVPERPDASRIVEIARLLADIVRSLDPTRPVTAALASPLMSNETAFPDTLDVVGYNYMEHFYEEDRRKFPDRVIYGSENGRNHEAWLAVEHNDYMSGQFIWTGIDYLGEAKGWPVRNSTSGMMDLAGFGKPLYHFKRSIWSDRDMVYLGVLRTGLQKNGKDGFIQWFGGIMETWDGVVGEPVTVVCCSNCPEVELFVNGKSAGTGRVADFPDRTIRWEILYEPGTLKAVGMKENINCCTHEIRSDGEPARLHLISDTVLLAADRQDIAHVEVAVTDKDGHLVYGADHEVICELSGPGSIIGIESGDPASHENYTGNTRKVYHGKMLIYIRSSDSPGVIRLRVTSEALEPASIEIIAQGMKR